MILDLLFSVYLRQFLDVKLDATGSTVDWNSVRREYMEIFFHLLRLESLSKFTWERTGHKTEITWNTETKRNNRKVSDILCQSLAVAVSVGFGPTGEKVGTTGRSAYVTVVLGFKINRVNDHLVHCAWTPSGTNPKVKCPDNSPVIYFPDTLITIFYGNKNLVLWFLTTSSILTLHVW